jgi:putative protein-disulfide isomerase
MVQFGEQLAWTFVMGGLVRDAGAANEPEQVYGRLIREWLAAAQESKMPFDPLLWEEGPIASSYPACMAVRAAAEQADDGGYRYLRRLREGLMCERRKLDHAEALVEEARGAGLDVERFRIDLHSHAITESFGSDLDRTNALAERDDPASAVGPRSLGSGGASLPSIVFGDEGGGAVAVLGLHPYDAYRDAALAAGAEPVAERAPSVLEVVERFGRVATREVELICELPGPRARAELYRMAEQWELRPTQILTGTMWELE